MPPSKKKRNTKKQAPRPTLTPQSTLGPSLPDDLLLSCIARGSRLHYPTLSLVSKTFRSLLASPELYKARSLLGHTEICLYVCMYSNSDQKPRWFTLCRKPHQTPTNETSKKKKSNGYVLAKVPIPHSPPVNNRGHGLVAVGSSIYNIGGSKTSSSVSVLDCMTHTWSEAPSFPVKLMTLTASVVDRKIYVAGCYEDSDSGPYKKSIEVLDTETQIWEPLPIKDIGFSNSKSACIDGKFRLETRTEVVAYNSNEGRWDLGRPRMHFEMNSNPYCEIENVLYSLWGTTFSWYDSEETEWNFMDAFEGLPLFPQGARVILAGYGGKMVVFWEEGCLYDGCYQKMIWCAVIALERRSGSKILGKVEWFDVVLIVPGVCDLVKAISVTV